MIMYFLTLILLIFWMYTCFGQMKHSGPYKTKLLSIGSCDEVGTNEVQFKTRLSKVNKTTLCYSGWVSLPYGLNDEMSENWVISVRGSTGGWKKNFISFYHKHACTDTKEKYPQWFDLLEDSKVNDTSCPIPKGNYSFSCLDLSNLQFERAPIMMYGRYRLSVQYYIKKVLVGCTYYEAELTPQEDISNKTKPPSALPGVQ